MVGFDIALPTAWVITASSFACLVYLFTTWPALDRQPTSGRFGGIGSRGNGHQNSADTSDLPQDALDAGVPWELGIPSPETRRAFTDESPIGVRNSSTTTRQRPSATLKQRIIRAGIYNKNGLTTFHMLRGIGCLVLFFAGLATVPLSSLSWTNGLVIGALAGLAGYLAPSFWLDYRLRVRQMMMRRALPDALDLLTVCMQGGLSLSAALSRVSQELGTAYPMLATELTFVEREIQMGLATGDSIRQLANRFNMEELRSMSSVIGQAERFGGSITGALRTYAEGLRVKRRQRAEERAQKAAVKLLFPTLLCIFPGIFVVILGPTAIRMYQVMIVGNPWGGG